MDLNLCKQCLACPRGSTQYVAGVNGFLDFAFRNCPSNGKISCPCIKCVNSCLLDHESVYGHLICNGMLRGYKDWVFHGESTVRYPSNQTVNHFPPEETATMYVGTDQLLHDAFGVGEDDSPSHSPNIMESNLQGQNTETSNFYKLLKELNSPLWEGCKLTTLSLLVLLMNTKITNKWSDKSFSDLLAVLHLAIPNGTNLPKSYVQVKKLLEKLGLGYEKIHACPNNCQLYWKDKLKDDSCSVCGLSRWKIVRETFTSTGRKKKKGVPAKVLRYFPLKSRLKRLFMCKETATLLRWHEEERTKDGILRHPADSISWKDFDNRHHQFSSDCRNIRLGLASDGFSPFGMFGSQYSLWPVVLILYNLPPWLCMKEPFLFLSTLIPGPDGPGQKIDVYLQPLIEELKELWEVGIETYDASQDECFILRVALFWTISDIPGLGYLSGYSVQGEFGCPNCNIETCSMWLKHGHKYCFMGHRRFLNENHPYRFDKGSFDGTEELRYAPVTPSGAEVLSQIEYIEENGDFEDSQTWKKKSIFFSLPYWKTNIIRHNLDFMHNVKNVGENVYGTCLGQQDKTKDNLNARLDLKRLGIRGELHPEPRHGKSFYLPPACFTMSREEKKAFCKVLRYIKVPNGYAGNISRCVNEAKCKLVGLKSHDIHILMQYLIPVAIRGLLPKHVTDVLFDLSGYIRDLCSRDLHPDKLLQVQERIKLTLCNLEMIFPPGFFTLMVHLLIHLVEQAILAGPPHLRWMYPIESFLAELKSYIRNNAHPEGSIAEARLVRESINFCSWYIDGFDTKITRYARKKNGSQRPNTSARKPSSLRLPHAGTPLRNCSTHILSDLERAQAHRYVLFNCQDVIPYLEMHAAEIKRKNRHRRPNINAIERIQNETFHDWFRDYVLRLEMDGNISSMPEELAWLARGPNVVVRKYRGFNVNGYKFRPACYDKTTQNSGIVLVAKTSSYTRANDPNPILGDVTYYGRLKQIIELDYMSKFSVMLFKCDWVDVTLGRGIKKDDYGFTLVNFSHLIHKGDKLEDEPYIFASQADQVFYVRHHLEPEWFTALSLKSREVNNMENEGLMEDDENELYHASFLANLTESAIQNQNWVRRDMEGTVVEVEETRHRRTNSWG